MIPQKISSYLEYCAYQKALWNAYQKNNQKNTRNIEIYERLMKHLEAAYYNTNQHYLLSPEDQKEMTLLTPRSPLSLK